MTDDKVAYPQAPPPPMGVNAPQYSQYPEPHIVTVQQPQQINVTVQKGIQVSQLFFCFNFV